jgi:scyllo-inosamine-4-phosphate amidinotransferase 1
LKVTSFNEWGVLKSVLIGTATNANFPALDEMFQLSMSQAGWTETPAPSGPVPQWIIDETNEDLDVLADTLMRLGIEVHRPDAISFEVPHFSESVMNMDWATDGQYAYCPRDNMLVIGDQVIEAPMSTRARQHEMIAYSKLRREAIKDGARWYAAPLPRLLDNEVGIDMQQYKLSEDDPIFDAANVCRFDSDLLYLVSSTGNESGGKWLQNMLGGEFKVHITDMYDSAHIDSTIVPLERGTVVLNASRVNDAMLPEFLSDWNKIYITEDMIEPQGFQGYPYASKWIAINMLALGNKRVVCDKNQPKIIAVLEKHGFTVIPLELRHSRTLGGGFHCVTLDLVRE